MNGADDTQGGRAASAAAEPIDKPLKDALPLQTIRVFVEAARRLSFSAAARNLGMTQGGVSHHVAALERYMGQPLFTRAASVVQLTDAGRLYFDTVQEAVALIELSTRQMRLGAPTPERLTVRTSLPSFAMAVLIPALHRFVAQPAVAVDVVTSLSPPGADDAYDVLITRDLDVPGADHWLLLQEELVCVGTPAMIQTWRDQPVAQWPFLASQSRPDLLATWWLAQHQSAGNPRVVASFAHMFLALPAALSGLGFLVLPSCLVDESLRHGLLVQRPGPMVRSGAGYRAYVNPQAASQAAATAFCRWLSGHLKSTPVA
jgi:LysR family transcriptional regulator, glycine cleavage system transcriptional activator